MKNKRYKNYSQSSKNGKVKIIQSYDSAMWLQTHKEMLAWQKTESFIKWRKKQFLKQGGTCYYCDESLFGKRQQVEHIIPKSRGGTNHRSNLAIACANCNKEKNTTLLTTKERKLLKEKNYKKRGTYHKIQNIYETESHLAQRLKDMF